MAKSRTKVAKANTRAMTKARTRTRSAQALAPRERLFDDGWRFLLGEAVGAEAAGFDDARWRRLDLPHDWSIEDLGPAEPEAAGVSSTECFLPVVEATWLFNKGDDPAWKEPGFDDSAWQSVRLPDDWEHHSNYMPDNVYGWYRRRVDIPAEYKGKDVTFLVGQVDDVDETFVNGVRVGGFGSFPPNYQTAYFEDRRYVVPANLLKYDGTDLVAVRVFDGPGSGGIVRAPAMTSERVRVGPFDTHASPGGKDTGYVVGGVGWYRKTFRLPASERGKSVRVRFDGVYMDSDVWLNGVHLGNHPYGYTSFDYDLTPHLNGPGKPNVLSVRVRNLGRNSRWYSGSGIYRHVWLTVTDPLHVGPYGVFVTTPEVSDREATVRIATTILNDRAAEASFEVRATIYDSSMGISRSSMGILPMSPTGVSPVVREEQRNSKDTAGTAVEHMGKMPMPRAGKMPATQGAAIAPARTSNLEVVQTLRVKRPKRWSVEEPNLYTAVVEIVENGAVVDRALTTFGIRTFSFDARAGFQLNGKTMKLKGGCVHHDNGPLGAATIDRAEVRRVELLKASGFDAIRTAHNPPSPAFLDACDRLGMLVMDESFDQWRVKKNPHDYHRFFDQWWQRDTDSMVLRDRNHPSIVAWSIGNEIPERFDPVGAELARMQADRVRLLDPTRPVTSALCGITDDKTDPICRSLDVAGYNYGLDRYVVDHVRRPERVILATETFPLQAFEYWMGVLDHAHVAGDFVWTAMDYLGECNIGYVQLEGEPNPERWPFYGANCGDLDICGVKRPQSYYRDVLWGRSRLEMAVHRPLPEGRTERANLWGWPDEERHWTWPDSARQAAGLSSPMQVAVYSTAQQVRLSVNGRVIGVKEVSRGTKFTAKFDVPYEPGELKAEALVGGKVVARQTFVTAGAPAKLRLTADRSRIAADRNDLSYVFAEVLDCAGNVVPDADLTIDFALKGPAELAAVANGNLREARSFQQPRCTPYRGRCLAIVRPKGKPGAAVLTAKAKGVAPSALHLSLGSFFTSPLGEVGREAAG